MMKIQIHQHHYDPSSKLHRSGSSSSIQRQINRITYQHFYKAMAFLLFLSAATVDHHLCLRNFYSTLLQVFIMILCFCINGLYTDCPNLCECKWKSGKESVICLNANLSIIPEHLDAGTQVLDLTGNNIVTIKHDEFSDAGLINLQKVYIAKCRLKTLDRYAFRHLINVIELDLSYNILVAIPSHTFDSIPELRELRLNGNPIQRIMNDAFIHIPRLVRLELTNCKIGTVEPRAFAGLENSLEWLNLDNNRINDIRSTTITSLRSLHGIELANNPWNCSCTLRPLREWMLRHNVPYGVPPVCRTPQRLAGKLWDRLELDEFACAPAIEAQISKAYGVEGRNVTMSCRIGGVPEPNVRWLLKNRVIANLSGVPYSTNGKKLYIVHLQDQASNLTILTADVQDAGTYVCTAENKAGRAEASVTLAVSRRPTDNSLATRLVIVTVIVAIIFLMGACLLIVCVCGVRKRQQARGLTLDQRREESYEKIEMNNKISNRANCTNNGNGIVGTGQLSGVNASASIPSGVIVGSGVRRRGDYRGVPTTTDTDMDGDEEDDAGYEDDIENTPTPSTTTRDAIKPWSSYGDSKVSSPLNVSHWTTDPGSLEADLHIPRRPTFAEAHNRDDRTRLLKSTSGTFNDFRQNNNNNNNNSENLQDGLNTITKVTSKPFVTTSGMAANAIPQVLHPHIMRKQMLEKGGGSLYTTSSITNSPSTERNYPDLLELSSTSTATTSVPYNSTFSDTYSGRKHMEQLNCTLPRKRTSAGFYGRASSKCHNSTDSEAPLLADSRYSSSGGEDNTDQYQLNRRLSMDASDYSYSSNINDSQRANSYLNLNTDRNSLRNQSLPNSPLIELSSAYSTSSINRFDNNSATPLLNINSLDARNNSYVTSRTRSPETSTNANTYDYHAAQLERFLEEYRSLQAQLNKMKETCEGIRQNEQRKAKSTSPKKDKTNSSASTIFDDPLLYNNMIVTSPDSEDLCTPKSILKSKNSATAGILSPLSGNTIPDAPTALTLTPGDYSEDIQQSTSASSPGSAYWLPRDTLLKRFNGNTGGNNYNFQS